MPNIVYVARAKDGELPFKRSTIYRFSSQRKYPEVIYRVGGMLVFDLDEWERHLKAAKEERVRESRRIHTI